MTDREVMQQALADLEYFAQQGYDCSASLTALRARLAEPETCKSGLQVEGPELSARGADASRGRFLLAKMQHQQCGPNEGWTLDELFPGDDPAAAVDAAMAKERGDE